MSSCYIGVGEGHLGSRYESTAWIGNDSLNTSSRHCDLGKPRNGHARTASMINVGATNPGSSAADEGCDSRRSDVTKRAMTTLVRPHMFPQKSDVKVF